MDKISGMIAAVVVCFPVLACGQLVIHPAGEMQERQKADVLRPAQAQDAALPNLERAATLRNALRYAFRRNPEICAAYSEWIAAIEKVPQSGALDDPKLSLSFNTRYLFGFNPAEKLGLVSKRESMGDEGEMKGHGRLLDALGLGFEQMIPGRGKRATRAEQALYDAQAAGYQYYKASRDLRQHVIEAYAELLQNRHRSDIEQQDLELNRATYNVSMSNLGAGMGTEADVLKNQTEVSLAETELRSARINERQFRAMLNSVLGRRADAPIAEPDAVRINWTKKKPAQLLEMAVCNNPELSALASEVRSRGAGVVLAELQYNPDFSIGTNITVLEQMLEAGVTLPINSERIDSQVREAVANAAAKQSRYNAAVYETLGKLVVALTNLDDAARILEDYENKLIPQYRRLMTAQLRNYGAGEGAYLEVFDTRRSLIQAERLVTEAQAQRLKAMAQIEAIAGDTLMTVESTVYKHENFAADITSGVTNLAAHSPINLDHARRSADEPTSRSAENPVREPAAPAPSNFPPTPSPRSRESGTTVGLLLTPPQLTKALGS